MPRTQCFLDMVLYQNGHKKHCLPFYRLEREKTTLNVPVCNALINITGQQYQQNQAQFIKAAKLLVQTVQTVYLDSKLPKIRATALLLYQCLNYSKNTH